MTLVVLFFVLLLVFVRNALFDVFEVQGDRIVGKETLPVCIGEQRTLFILHIIMAVLVVLLLLMPLLGFMSAAGFWLLPDLGPEDPFPRNWLVNYWMPIIIPVPPLRSGMKHTRWLRQIEPSRITGSGDRE